MRKSEIKLRKKLNKFYQREYKAIYVKIDRSRGDDKSYMDFIAQELNPKNYERFKGAIRNMRGLAAYSGDDFRHNLITARVEYTYPKYGNM